MQIFSHAGYKLIGSPKFFPGILQNKTVPEVILCASGSFINAYMSFKY